MKVDSFARNVDYIICRMLAMQRLDETSRERPLWVPRVCDVCDDNR